MSRHLHIFLPENDLALACDKAGYTPPPAAAQLRRSGATLPMWYCDDRDVVAVQGVNAGWLRKMRDTFGLGAALFDGNADSLVPAPWGWSRATRKILTDLGFGPAQLPDDSTLAMIRDISHRRTAAAAARLLAERLPFTVAPAAEEIRCADELRRFSERTPGGTVLKLPWSSSGRGLTVITADRLESRIASVEGMIRRQGSVMAEPLMDKRLDFAMLFTMTDGGCDFDGYSLFRNNKLGAYAGNVLATQEELETAISAFIPRERLDAVRTELPSVLTAVAPHYRGPLGVDMMAVEADGYAIAPVVEINFRMTMGHVSRLLYSRHIAQGARGTYSVQPADAALRHESMKCSVHDGRLTGGTIDLAQPGSDFSFVVTIE